MQNFWTQSEVYFGAKVSANNASILATNVSSILCLKYTLVTSHFSSLPNFALWWGIFYMLYSSLSFASMLRTVCRGGAPPTSGNNPPQCVVAKIWGTTLQVLGFLSIWFHLFFHLHHSYEHRKEREEIFPTTSLDTLPLFPFSPLY